MVLELLVLIVRQRKFGWRSAGLRATFMPWEEDRNMSVVLLLWTSSNGVMGVVVEVD